MLVTGLSDGMRSQVERDDCFGQVRHRGVLAIPAKRLTHDVFELKRSPGHSAAVTPRYRPATVWNEQRDADGRAFATGAVRACRRLDQPLEARDRNGIPTGADARGSHHRLGDQVQQKMTHVARRSQNDARRGGPMVPVNRVVVGPCSLHVATGLVRDGRT